MKNIYRTASNSARFIDADLETTLVFTSDDMTGFAAGDTVVDYMGNTQTILELSVLPGGFSRVVLARL